jgi:predicted nucleotidyltransferase component of viral defense system
MLHNEAVLPGTLALLKELLALKELSNFALVGGTALALRYGHRHSEDLDLFCNLAFERQVLLNTLIARYGSDFVHQETGFKKSLFCSINGVKVDAVYYPHTQIRSTIFEDGIPMYADEDIAAMKIQAILGRGKKKDFWDLALLLENHGLDNIMNWHLEKFPNQMLLISIPQTITYFDDAEMSKEPECLRGLSWDEIKSIIRKAVREYLS